MRSGEVRCVHRGAWTQVFHEDGTPVAGIRGRPGATGDTAAGQPFGADAIEMQPGSAFPLHVHVGDHLLYVIRGRGSVEIGGRARPVRTGDTIYIPADVPHAVTAAEGSTALFFLAVGLPHRDLSSPDRMQLVDPVHGA